MKNPSAVKIFFKLSVFCLFAIVFALSIFRNTENQITSRISRLNLPDITSLLENSHRNLEKDIPLIVTDDLEFLLAINIIKERKLYLAYDVKLTEKTQKFLCLNDFIVLTREQYVPECAEEYNQQAIWEEMPFVLWRFIAR